MKAINLAGSIIGCLSTPLLLLLLLSCEPETATERDVRETERKQYLSDNIIEIEIDGCEYLTYTGGYYLTHKGNCSNHKTTAQ